MTSATAVLNILYGNQQRMYNVIFAELYWNIWGKPRADDGILKFSHILGQFMMKRGGRRSKLHDQELYEF